MNPDRDHNSLIAGLQERIRTVLARIIPDGPLALVDFPDHPNVGDSAIWLGEVVYLTQEHGIEPWYCSSLATHDDALLRRRAPEGTILIHGGGNFGTLWPHHQDFRIQMMAQFKGRPIVQLPQSIHFADDGSIDATARAIEQHGAFTLLVRDEWSFEMARAKFACEVHLCPDMAFYIGAAKRSAPEVDVLCLLRSDAERVANMDTPDTDGSLFVTDWLRDSRARNRIAKLTAKLRALLSGGNDMARTLAVFNAVAWSRFHRGLDTLSQGRTVVTDRLHAHILSILLDIPHVALDNSYGKLSRFIQIWTGDYQHLRRATRMGEALAKAKTLL